MATDVCKLLQKWRNIPDVVYSVNTTLRQQLLPGKTYEKTKLQQYVDDLQNVLTKDWHPYNECMPKDSPVSLYISHHDKMLRPYYHYLLSVYGFNEENESKE